MTNRKSIGILIEESHQSVYSDNHIEGFDIGMQIGKATQTHVFGNVFISPEALEIFSKLRTAVDESSIDENSKQSLKSSIAEMQSAFGGRSIGDRYNSFMAVLSDHMQVLGAVVTPLMEQLARII